MSSKLKESTKAKKSLLHSIYVGGASFLSSFVAQTIDSGFSINAIMISIIAFIISVVAIFCFVMQKFDTTEYELEKDFIKKTGRKPRDTTKNSNPNRIKMIDVIRPWGQR